MTAGTYAAVDAAGLAAILAALPAVRQRLGGEAPAWRIREVGDGNLNLVFIVEGEAGGVVVKQALPYVRMVGDSWPLPLERSWFEYSALIEQARYAPRLTPEVFHFDRAQAMIVMEYLHPHIVMRKGLIRGVLYPQFASDIAEFLAATLFSTSVLAGSAAEHKARVALFAPNTAMCKITEDLVFTDPYRQAPLNRWNHPHLDAHKQVFENDGALKIAAQARKYQFMTSAQALIHGDLHTGSIMVTATETRVIDPEFAFVGPIGFDVGAVIGNLLLASFRRTGIRRRRTSATATARGFRPGKGGVERICDRSSRVARATAGDAYSSGSLGLKRIARRSRRNGNGSCASCSRMRWPSRSPK